MNERTRSLVRRRMIFAAVILVILLIFGYAYTANAVKIYQLSQEEIKIAQKIENEAIRSKQLDEQVKQMGSKYYVENFARQYLGLFYPDETIVIVEVQE